MSSLNINELNTFMHNKSVRKIELYGSIIDKIHHKIRYNARMERTYCFYSIPEFIIGLPPYNVQELTSYIKQSLMKDKFQFIYVDPNWLFIHWNTTGIHMDKKKKKNTGKYKMIEEYKPSGQFVYNDYDLLSIQQKARDLI